MTRSWDVWSKVQIIRDERLVPWVRFTPARSARLDDPERFWRSQEQRARSEKYVVQRWASAWRGGRNLGPSQDGRLEHFVRAKDDALWHTWQEAPGGSRSEWDRAGSEGGGFAGSPALVLNTDGRLGLFVRAKDGSLWQK